MEGRWLSTKTNHSLLRCLYSELPSGSISDFYVIYWKEGRALTGWGQLSLFLAEQIGGEWFKQHRKINWLHWLLPLPACPLPLRVSSTGQFPSPHAGLGSGCSSCVAEAWHGATKHSQQRGNRIWGGSASALPTWICSISGRGVHNPCPPLPPFTVGI